MQNQLEKGADWLSRRGFVQSAGSWLALLAGGSACGSVLAAEAKRRKRISFFRDGEIHVAQLGQEGARGFQAILVKKRKGCHVRVAHADRRHAIQRLPPLFPGGQCRRDDP
jgi:hypothetical protein